jgi:alkyl sulfatase BDS1-like metallo-beta-lactamase superfamily hydrolase
MSYHELRGEAARYDELPEESVIHEIREWFERVVPERVRESPRTIRGVRGAVLFRITGEGGETWTLRIDDPAVRAEPAETPRPDLTLTLDRATFLAVVNGSLSGSSAYKQGKVKVGGNLLLGLQIAGLLESRPASPSDDFV